ncbi:hypothetical protein [Streptomyces sp. PTD5-9]|uniref:hypothetical protein n=1 Tax=Streptomyces sp. PTD5-9 TaxID=3120150 RepID=UPI0030084DEA
MGRLKRAWCVVGMVVAVGVGAAGCGKEEPPDYVGAGQVCGGIFAGPLEKTVESVTGGTSFAWTNGKGMQRVVDGLKDAYVSGHRWAIGGQLCQISPKDGGQKSRARINFDMYAPEDLDGSYSRNGRDYTMGKDSGAAPAGASLYFECVSPEFKGSKENPMRISGGFTHGKATAQKTPEHFAENMKIIHAASLAVAKKLQCENNGGLPEKAVLTPRS